MTQLTTIMVGQLLYMLEHSSISYADENSRTLVALKQRAFVTYSRGGRYGKAHWSLTDLGTDTAKHLLAKKRGKPHAVFLTPTMYGEAQRQGFDMLDYVIQKPIPVDEPPQPSQKTGWDAFADAVKSKAAKGEPL
jgi:hypothetical protein